jgi:hypothetical protein
MTLPMDQNINYAYHVAMVAARRLPTPVRRVPNACRAFLVDQTRPD